MIKINNNFKRLEGQYVFKEVADRVKRSERNDLISLSVGDAVLPLSGVVTESMKKACDEMAASSTFKGYPPYGGYGFLKDKISNYYSALGVNVLPDEIFISDGAKSDVDRLIDLFSPSKALIHDPSYPAYAHASIVKGNEVVYLPATEENDFLPAPRKAQGCGYLIYICSPDNPTGQHYGREGLKAWVDFALETGSVIIFDSAYSFYVEGGIRSVFEIEGAEKCAIEICSLSKLGGFTGIRCGWTVICDQLEIDGERLSSLFLKRQSGMFNGVSYISQVGAAAVLEGEGLKFAMDTVKYYKDNAKAIKKALKGCGIDAYGGENSPYVWAKCPHGMGSFDFFDRLLTGYGVVCTPGVGFGSRGERYFRLTGFLLKEDLHPAIERLLRCIEEI